MELLNIIQSILPIGVITLSVLTLLGVALLAALVLWVGQQFIKVAINSNHDKAPKYEFLNKNIILRKLVKCMPLSDEGVEETYNGWVRVCWVDSEDGTKWYATNILSFWWVGAYCSSVNVRCYCVFKSKEAARGIKWSFIFNLLSLDVLLWLLPQYFLPTIILLTIGGLLWTTRTISGKVYENTSKIGFHEGKITDLESKLEKEGE